MSNQFVVDIESLDYGAVFERRVQLWRERIAAGVGVPPIKVRERSGRWVVHSGADAVEAAKREGQTQIECVLV